MIKMERYEYELPQEEDLAYCGICRHFRCPVAEGDELGEHLPDEPCGYYDCCIN